MARTNNLGLTALALGVCVALGCGDDTTSARNGAAASRLDASADVARADAGRGSNASSGGDARAAIPICGELTQTCPADASVLEPTNADAAVANVDDGDSKVSCDPRPVLCKKAPPTCEFGWVPVVVGTCYGDCVKVERCVCTEADACPQREQYVCHMSAGHCGPYVH